MEFLTMLIELLPTVGFPIVCVIAMGVFIFTIYRNTTKESKDREDKLNKIIIENQVIINDAIETIAKYAEKLEVIQGDINEIKTEITILASKAE